MDHIDGRGDPPPRLESLTPLGTAFFDRPTAEVARDLLGKILVSRAGDTVTGGVIVETEAYLGRDDPGSHAATKGMTRRNAVMYGAPGTVYVYFTYGNHHMLNLVCESESIAGAVLVRALRPEYGIEPMRQRRGGISDTRGLANGPGKLAAALGIDLSDNGSRLGLGRLTVYDSHAPASTVRESGRVGLSSGHELQLRFYLDGDEFVSKGRTGRRTVARSGARPRDV